MAITRGSERDLLLPGLAGVEGRYPQIPRQWPGFFARRMSKMALERIPEMRYTGLAQLKAEGAATPFDNSPGERFLWQIENNSYGLGTSITREALEDNLYKDHFGPTSIGLSESFAQMEEIVHANIINQGTTANASFIGDAQPLFSTAHPIDNGTYANRPSPDLDLNETSVEYALQQIRVFPDQAGNRMLARGEKALVPIPLEYTMKRLMAAELRPGTNTNDPNAYVLLGGLSKGFQVCDYFTSSYLWAVLSNIEGLVHFERTPFEIDMQVDPITQNLLLVGFMRFGAGVKNPRGIWGSAPTA